MSVSQSLAVTLLACFATDPQLVSGLGGGGLGHSLGVSDFAAGDECQHSSLQATHSQVTSKIPLLLTFIAVRCVAPTLGALVSASSSPQILPASPGGPGSARGQSSSASLPHLLPAGSAPPAGQRLPAGCSQSSGGRCGPYSRSEEAAGACTGPGCSSGQTQGGGGRGSRHSGC